MRNLALTHPHVLINMPEKMDGFPRGYPATSQITRKLLQCDSKKRRRLSEMYTRCTETIVASSSACTVVSHRFLSNISKLGRSQIKGDDCGSYAFISMQIRRPFWGSFKRWNFVCVAYYTSTRLIATMLVSMRLENSCFYGSYDVWVWVWGIRNSHTRS